MHMEMEKERETGLSGLSGLLKKWKLGKWQALVLAGGLAGLLLLCITSLPGSKGAEGGNKNPASESIRVDLTDYERQLEERLCAILGSIAGAGETRVMLTLDCGSEPIYATQGDTDQKSHYGEGGSEEAFRASKEYVVIGTGSGAQGLVLKMIEPQVRGVAVICQGGDDLLVRQAIVEAVTAVLGVGSNKVSVAKLGAVN
jgi:stage III sporulation protein AG